MQDCEDELDALRADAGREFRCFGKALTVFALKVDRNRFVTKVYSYYFLTITLQKMAKM